jgi:uncharacterized protein
MYNGHIHIFNGKCAPDDFLKVGLPGFLDGFADNIKDGLESKLGRKLIKLTLAHGKNENRIKRAISFFDIGLEASQRRVFERVHTTYKHHDPKYFALTLNMDYMSKSPSNHTRFDTQLTEVLQLKQSYPNQLLVFLSCDPRYKKGVALRDWFKKYYEEGKVVGIKLYPALGYFPFDPGLYELYEYANQYKIPVLTHTTRTGVFYLSEDVRQLVGVKPLSFDPANPIMTQIYSRIDKYNASKNKKVKRNQHYCNIFTHPDNYVPMIEKFPNLKLCYAHYGGEGEILDKTEDFMLEVENNRSVNWHKLIREYMLKYNNVYTDISYTLANVDTHKRFIEDMKDPKLQQRIFFGTDYFMEEREDSEENVFANFRNSFLPYPNEYKLMTETTPFNFLYK